MHPRAGEITAARHPSDPFGIKNEQAKTGNKPQENSPNALKDYL